MAHLVVATTVTGAAPSSDIAIGAVLPDLASMAGARIDRARLPGPVAEGVLVHHRTDEAFHGHPWFVDALRNDVTVLEAAGLPRGAARASAHVGAELLLDGVLLEDDDVAVALGQAVDALDLAQLGDLDDQQRERWAMLFDRMRGGMSRSVYASPEAVAERLRHLLARRPRLSLPPSCEPALVDHLAWRRAKVVAIAPCLVADVTATVRDSGSGGWAA